MYVCMYTQHIYIQGNLHNPTLHGTQSRCQITEVVRLQRLSDYRDVGLKRLSDYRGCQITEVVRLQRLSDYPVFLSTVKHGECFSEYGQVRENVGLLRCWITEVSLYYICTLIIQYIGWTYST